MEKGQAYVRVRDTGSSWFNEVTGQVFSGKKPVLVTKTNSINIALRHGALMEIQPEEAELTIKEIEKEAATTKAIEKIAIDAGKSNELGQAAEAYATDEAAQAAVKSAHDKIEAEHTARVALRLENKAKAQAEADGTNADIKNNEAASAAQLAAETEENEKRLASQGLKDPFKMNRNELVEALRTEFETDADLKSNNKDLAKTLVAKRKEKDTATTTPAPEAKTETPAVEDQKRDEKK